MRMRMDIKVQVNDKEQVCKSARLKKWQVCKCARLKKSKFANVQN
jgi:hypothetical protein